MKKTTWIIAIVLVMAIAAGLYYFQPWKKKEAPPADEDTKSKDTNTTTTTTTNTNTNTNTNANATGQTPLKVSNSGFVLRAQKDLNTTFVALKVAGMPDVPAKLKEDGKFGAITSAAIKYVYSLAQSIDLRKLVKPADITGDTSGFSYDLVHGMCALVVEPQYIAALLSYKKIGA